MNVVFDLGGVLLTWDPAAIASSVFDTPQDQQLVLDAVFGHPDWVELDRGTLPVADAITRAVRRTGLSARGLAAMFEAVPLALVPIPQALDLVKAVREAGNRVYALSNLHRSSLAHVESAYDVFDLFDGRVVSCEVGACKPEGEIYAIMIERHDLDPRESLFIDDVMVNLEAAATFGMRTLRFDAVDLCRADLRLAGCI